jgi:hypothetical protein
MLGVLVVVTTRSPAQMEVRSLTGIGAEKAVAH